MTSFHVLHHAPSLFLGAGALVFGGAALEHIARPGRSAGQQVGNAAEAVGLGIGAGVLGLAGLKVHKVTSFFSGDKVKKPGESAREQADPLREQIRTLLGGGPVRERVKDLLRSNGSRQENRGSNEQDSVKDDMASARRHSSTEDRSHPNWQALYGKA